MDKLISQQAAIDAIKKRLFETAFNNVGIKQDIDETLVDVAENRLEKWFDELPSVQPDIIRCKDCIYQTESWSGIKYCEAHGDHIGKDYDYCSNARRKENG